MNSIGLIFHQVRQQTTNFLENNFPPQNKVSKMALTVLLGVGVFISGEAIVRIPFIKNSNTYVLIPHIFIQIAGALDYLDERALDILECISPILVSEENLYKSLIRPILEELGYRLLLQEVILRQGTKLFIKVTGIPLDADHLCLRITRVVISSLVFAAGHTWAFDRSPTKNPYGAAALVDMIVIGAILGIAQELTGNTIYPIALHVINNTMTTYLTEDLLFKSC